MKRRTIKHFGDTYGEDVWVACDKHYTKKNYQPYVTANFHDVTCKKCQRFIEVEKIGKR